MRTILAFLMLVTPAMARPRACRVVQKQIVVANEVVVPFAVPVATVVATATPGGALYSASQYHSPPSAVAANADAAPTATADDLKLFEEFIRWKATRVQAAAEKPSLVKTLCAGCHGPDGKQLARDHFTLKDLESADGRLHAIDAIVNAKMPKGKQIDADTVGKLIVELSANASPQPPKAQLAPPPEPTPPKPEKEQ